ncbi:MAG: recombinase family protein [Methylobacterium mesophilicum]|nr:recombinase family protein [Methylobacterium mesophilicum]
MTRAVGYIRVSTRRQANEGVSLDVQQDRIASFIAEKGWNLGELYIDRGASARDDGRPQFQRMLSDAKACPAPFDAIVVFDRSRFFRNAAQSELTIRDLRRRSIEVFSVTQPNGSDEAGDMVRQLIAVVDEHASRETAKRVRGTMVENARQGFWNGAAPPFGYKTVVAEKRGKKEKKKLAVDDVEASVVDLNFSLAEMGDQRSGAMGVKAIADHLNTKGYRTRRGNLWHIGPLHDLLTSTVYRGEYVYNTVDSNTRLPRPESQHVKVACPVIIEPRRFEAVQTLLRSRNPRISPPRLLTGPILLTGLLICEKCGSAMTMRTGKSGKYKYYACANRQARGGTACRGCSHPMDAIDAAVTDALAVEAFRPKRLADIIGQIDADRHLAASSSSELLRLEQELTDARGRITRLLQLVELNLADGTDPDFADRLRAAQRDRDIALAGAERVRRRIGPQIDITPERIIGFATFMRDRICDGEIPYRKAYIRSVVETISVNDDRLTIAGRKDVLRDCIVHSTKQQAEVPTSVQEWRTRQDSNL